MQEFKNVFEAYGADYATTMARFMGNETMYLKFLDMFIQEENLQQLEDALKAGDLTVAFECAHTLKGVTGNMGLTPLFDAICAIVEHLRRGEYCDDPILYQNIQTEFQRVHILWRELKETTT